MSRPFIDYFLAECVRHGLHGSPRPAWPAALGKVNVADILQRIRFHGIALLLVQSLDGMRDWPVALAEQVRDDARLQALWEASHRRTVAELVTALYAAGIPALLLKGTAIAYAFYPDPAVRRRGDTDILLLDPDRHRAKAVLAQCGFRPCGNPLSSQVAWACQAPGGFVHEVDMHWNLSSSATVAAGLEQLRPEQRQIALPKLAPGAAAFGPIDNLIMVCVNRAAHQAFGYHVDEERPKDGDRLIWAIDVHLLCSQFNTEDWETLSALAEKIGARRLVHSALMFASDAIDTTVPAPILQRLADRSKPDRVSDYLGPASTLERFRSDLAASRGIREKVAMITRHAFPIRSFMDEHYPATTPWPLAAAWARRLLTGGFRMLRRAG